MKPTQINAIKRIINNNQYRSALQGVFTDSDGRTIAADAYRIIRTLETVPADIPRADGLDVSKFFNDPIGYDIILPTIKELQALIKEQRERGIKPVYDFGEDLPMVNAKYLLDMLRIFPDAICYRSAENCKNKALFFQSSTGDGLIMPIFKR